ncbi:MAG: hypothetical protein SH848_00410 [Saprospiraceae bacterium]|nr:hypothetical protein [Saprospiraceae bacterium]
MRILYPLCILILHNTIGSSQKHDYSWLMGQNHQSIPINSGTVIDFNTTPPDIYYEFRDMSFRQANASICDASGNLLFYTNGIYIANALNEPMESGQGLNPGWFANEWEDYGYILDQGAMILPMPERDSLYLLLHMDRALNEQQTDIESWHFYSSLVNMNANNGLGSVVSKNQIIDIGPFDIGEITAVKLANGRDWWMILRRLGTNEYPRFLVIPEEVVLYQPQELGIIIPEPPGSLGQAVFSPDGAKYAKVNLPGYAGDPIYISIFDFDRCSGELSNPVQFTYVDTASAAGIAISPNSRFLYISSGRYLYQYDLHAENIESSKIKIAEWDGFSDPLHPILTTKFYLAQVGPDNKIYINCTSSARYLHVINHPDSLGLACGVCQHCIELPSLNSFSLPNFPNYRLGALEGSPCDTLRQPPRQPGATKPPRWSWLSRTAATTTSEAGIGILGMA